MKIWKLPRLSRGGKILRNLTLALLASLYAWVGSGYPIADPVGNFRRIERANLMGPAEIQGVFQNEQGWQWVAAVEEDQAVLFQHGTRGGALDFWPREKEGATLIPVPVRASQFEREREIVAVDIPEGTAFAWLELTVGCWHSESDLSRYQMISATPDIFDSTPLRWWRTYTAEGELLRDGGVLFRVVSSDEDTDPGKNVATVERMALEAALRWETFSQSPYYRSVDCRMEAVFCDEGGGELGRAALSTPEGGESHDP